MFQIPPGYPDPRSSPATTALLQAISALSPPEQVQAYYNASSTPAGSLAARTDHNTSLAQGLVVGALAGALGAYLFLRR